MHMRYLTWHGSITMRTHQACYSFSNLPTSLARCAHLSPYTLLLTAAFSALFLQAYKGPATSCSVPIEPSSRAVVEARVRCFASCELNGKTELVWGNFSPTQRCQCIRAEEVVGEEEEEKGEKDGEENPRDKPGLKSRLALGSKQVGFLALLLVSALVLSLAFLLGHFLV